MKHAVARALGCVVATACVALPALLGAAPAQASGSDLGWVRLQPASGRTDVAVTALTEAACPQGNAASVKVGGPGIPTDGSVGNIVGVIQLKSLVPTVSGQLWVPLSFTLKDWFSINGVDVKAGGTYTITVICRDLARASKTYGSFVGKVTLDGKGGYVAVGESARAFNTGLDTDPTLDGIVPGTSTAPTAEASSPAAPSSSTAEPSVSTPPPSGEATSAGPGPEVTEAPEPASTAAAPVDSGSSGRLLLVGLGVLALLGVTATYLRGRSGPPDPAPTEHEPERLSTP